jgi:hypothetical protein
LYPEYDLVAMGIVLQMKKLILEFLPKCNRLSIGVFIKLILKLFFKRKEKGRGRASMSY